MLSTNSLSLPETSRFGRAQIVMRGDPVGAPGGHVQLRLQAIGVPLSPSGIRHGSRKKPTIAIAFQNSAASVSVYCFAIGFVLVSNIVFEGSPIQNLGAGLAHFLKNVALLSGRQGPFVWGRRAVDSLLSTGRLWNNPSR